MSMTLAGGASTQSRGRRPLPPGAVRGMTIAAHGAREVVHFDYEDGHHEQHELLSWIGGQAGLLFGSSPDLIELPFDIQYLRETNGSYGHVAEYELADALGEVFDGYLTSSNMSCRFFQSGGEACAAAVRIARAATGWDEIAINGYHGAGLEFVHLPNVLGSASPMTLPIQRRFEFGDKMGMWNAVRSVLGIQQGPDGRAACILVEVPAWDNEESIAEFLRECRKEADRQSIPLIVDDVVCGFRLALAGSCERYGVKADMVCLGKSMSATGCVSAIVGRADLIEHLGKDTFYSTTFGGSPGPCSVATATVRWLTKNRMKVYGGHGYDIVTGIFVDEFGNATGGFGGIPKHYRGHLDRVGQALKDGLNARGVKCIGQPERSIVVFDTDDEWLSWCGRMIEQGVMIHRPNFPSMAHTMADVEKTLRAIEAIQEKERA